MVNGVDSFSILAIHIVASIGDPNVPGGRAPMLSPCQARENPLFANRAPIHVFLHSLLRQPPLAMPQLSLLGRDEGIRGTSNRLLRSTAAHAARCSAYHIGCAQTRKCELTLHCSFCQHQDRPAAHWSARPVLAFLPVAPSFCRYSPFHYLLYAAIAPAATGSNPGIQRVKVLKCNPSGSTRRRTRQMQNRESL